MSTRKSSGKWIHGPITVKAKLLKGVSPSLLGFTDEHDKGEVYKYNDKFFVQLNGTAWEATDLPQHITEMLNDIANKG